MKLFIAYADNAGVTDGVSQGQLIDHLPTTTTLAEADAVVIIAVCHPNFKFNHGLNEYIGKKPIIIIDYLEYGWQYAHDKTNVLGMDYCNPCAMPDNHDWGTLNLFVGEATPALQFKRELRKADVSERVVPLDYLAHLTRQHLQSKPEYDARPIDVLNVWGYSHPSRARVHGDIFHAMGNKGINVVDSFDALGSHPRTWVSIMRHYTVRKPMSEVLRVQSQAKISLSLYGSGRKCFRSLESPENCVMAHLKNDLAWSYPWDESNSILLNEGQEVDELIEDARRDDLYDLYLASQITIDKYRRGPYIHDYLLPLIASRI